VLKAYHKIKKLQAAADDGDKLISELTLRRDLTSQERAEEDVLFEELKSKRAPVPNVGGRAHAMDPQERQSDKRGSVENGKKKHCQKSVNICRKTVIQMLFTPLFMAGGRVPVYTPTPTAYSISVLSIKLLLTCMTQL
jgi:hypothetical protein